MSTKAYYPISEIGKGKVGFSKTRSIIEGAFYGNNVVKVNTCLLYTSGKMSGHSKFANIKHKKEKNDAAKGKIFTVIGREIAVAVKEGGADPANNSKLRDVIAKAKANNMPNDTIDLSLIHIWSYFRYWSIQFKISVIRSILFSGFPPRESSWFSPWKRQSLEGQPFLITALYMASPSAI